MIKISAILNVHNEDNLVDRSYQSLIKCIEHAANNNIQTELIIVADNPSEGIINYFQNKNERYYNFHIVQCRDLSMARNSGAEKCRGEYIAFFDGDDLWSSNWLTECYINAKKSTKDVVYHPEASLYFDQMHQAFFHIDSEEENFCRWDLLENNYWTSQVFLKRQVFLENPQYPLNIEKGFGYEDWQWNCNTLAKHIQHKIVPNTYHFIRVKKTGLTAMLKRNNCILPPVSLFNPSLIDKHYKSLD
jgi:glycosyltransferase involved in cell wall biosynthesis